MYFVFFYAVVLFFIITPKVFITLPIKNKYIVVLIHSLLFATIWIITYKWVCKLDTPAENMIGTRLALLVNILDNTSITDTKLKIKMINDIGIQDPEVTTILNNTVTTSEQQIKQLNDLVGLSFDSPKTISNNTMDRNIPISANSTVSANSTISAPIISLATQISNPDLNPVSNQSNVSNHVASFVSNPIPSVVSTPISNPASNPVPSSVFNKVSSQILNKKKNESKKSNFK